MQESADAEVQRVKDEERARTEEEVIMEYVRKQSLLEEKHRRRAREGRDGAGEGSRGA